MPAGLQSDEQYFWIKEMINEKTDDVKKPHNLKGYNQGLEMKIRGAFERLKDSPDREAKRNAHKQMAGLMALRNPAYVRELEYQKFGCYL